MLRFIPGDHETRSTSRSSPWWRPSCAPSWSGGRARDPPSGRKLWSTDEDVFATQERPFLVAEQDRNPHPVGLLVPGRWRRALRVGATGEDEGAPYDLHFPVRPPPRAVVPAPRHAPAHVTGVARGARPMVVIAEPTLTGTGGHHREIALATARAYRDWASTCHVLANRRFRVSAEDLAADGIVPVPAFGATVYETLRRAPARRSELRRQRGELRRGSRRRPPPARRPAPVPARLPDVEHRRIAGATLLRPTFLRPGSAGAADTSPRTSTRALQSSSPGAPMAHASSGPSSGSCEPPSPAVGFASWPTARP